MDAAAELETLRAMCEGAEKWTEGGQPVAYLPRFRFKVQGEERVADLLLMPFAHSGYETRLFFREPQTTDQAWSTIVVCGQPWHAVSWRGVMPDLPWRQILAAHLRALA